MANPGPPGKVTVKNGEREHKDVKTFVMALPQVSEIV